MKKVNKVNVALYTANIVVWSLNLILLIVGFVNPTKFDIGLDVSLMIVLFSVLLLKELTKKQD